MNILIAIHGFPPQYNAGAENRAYRMANWLSQQGHQVHVICIQSITSGDSDRIGFVDDLYRGIPVHRLSLDHEKFPDSLRRSFYHPEIGRHVEAYLKDLKPDLMHLISGYLMTASVISAANHLQIPIVITLTDFWFLCRRITLRRSDGRLCHGPTPLDCTVCFYHERRRYRLPSRFFPRLMDCFWKRLTRHPGLARWINLPDTMDAFKERQECLQKALNQVGAIISPSKFLRNRFIAEGVNPDKLMFSRQGLPSDVLGHESRGRKKVAPPLRIGYLGQLAEHKGVHILIEAFNRLGFRHHEAQLTLYGNPSRFPQYVSALQHTTKGNSHIIWGGQYVQHQVSQVLSELDVVVVPSICYENSPNTILEAFANRTPVVASNLGGIAELVRHDVNGLLFEAGNVNDLAEKLQWLIDEPERLEQLRRGIRAVKTLDEEMQDLLTIYQSLILPQPCS